MRFCDVLEIRNGKNQRKVENPNGKYPIYGSGGIMGWADDYICPQNTVIIGRKGSINNPIYVDTPFWNVDTAFGLVANSEILLPKYLYYFCCAFNFDVLSTTVTIPSLTKANLLQIEIDLPSLEKQQEIVGILDCIADAENVLNDQISCLDDLVKSRFVEMFGDPHHSNLYPYRIVKEFTNICSGGTPSRKNDSYWKEGTIRWVKTTELQNCVIYDTEEKITLEALEKSSAKLVPADTVLIAMYGQGKTRGMTGYLNIESTTNQACACILPSKEVNQKYLWRYFMMSYEELRGLAVGAGQPNLTGDMIKNFPVLMPPLDLQEEYVAFAELADKSKLTDF